MRISKIWILVLVCLFGCKEESTLKLDRYVLQSENIDTLAYYSKYHINLLRVRDYGYLGDFKSEYVFLSNEDSIGYKVDSKDFDVEFSNLYLGLVKKEKASFGWFYVEKHQVASSIAKVDSIVTALERMYLGKIVHERNGFFTIYDNGKLVKKLNLGEFLIDNDSVDFDDLEFGIYQVKKRNLVKVNNDGTKLLQQIDGLYFVPSPGSNVVTFWKMNDVLSKISTAVKSQSLPKDIKIN